jgi:DNA topoisomerase-1
MKLVIVESPSKAKTISKYLGDGYIVRASVGHVRDLPKSNKNAVDIAGGFIPHYEISERKKDVVKELRDLAAKADEVILASDPDREGEAIAWHVAEVLTNQKGSKKAVPAEKIKRITFNEITKSAVQEAIKHPRHINEDLRRAQEARRVLDRLVGYDLSGLIWKKVRYGLSAGRVQSPALRIIMEREREIRAFKPEDYWIITADVKKGQEKFLLTCTEEPRDHDLVDKIVTIGERDTWVVKDIKETERKRYARPPFKTSTLQQAASSRYGFSPARTMGIAQKLYEAGLITYMRTDSLTLAKSAEEQISKVIKERYGANYSLPHHYATTSKTAQEAHEAIRPTDVTRMSAGANEEQKKLYDLIWRRTITSQMVPANLLKTKVSIQIGDGEIPDFAVNGSRTIFPGWLAADPAAQGEDIEVPKLALGDVLDLIKMYVEDKQTQPPNRYSEAGLVKELEKRGIGRPSTYASIIKTLVDRGYVLKENKSLLPTDTGEVVSSFLENNFTNYVSDSFTAEMEDELDDIANGTREYTRTLEDFYGPFVTELEAKKDIPKLTDLGAAPAEFRCPVCGSAMTIKLGRGGKFLSCSRFPDCTGALTMEGKPLAEDKSIGADPESGEDIFIMHGPYGPYVQIGKKTKENKKPRRASIPPDQNPEEVTLAEALKYLSLPRLLGTHPETGEDIEANIGRFGPYIALKSKPKPDYRSLKEDDVYTIELPRALEILAEPKKRRGSRKETPDPVKKKK